MTHHPFSRHWLVIFLILVSTPFADLRAQTDSLFRSYESLLGSLPNIESGAKSTIGLTSLTFDQINYALQQSRYNNIVTRSLNFLGVQFYLGAFAYGTLPHEYFGHYSRAQEFDVQPDGYEIFFPSFGGNVPFSMTYATDVVHRQMIAAAGPELTTQVAYEATKALYSGEMVSSYYGMYLLGGKLVDSYIYARNDLDAFVDDPAQYLRDAEDYFAEYNVPNDPVSYLLALVEQYGYYDELINPEDTWATFPADPSVLINDFVRDQSDRIRRAYLFQLLDPANLYALYAN